eukprot:TRINITY_DN67001_c0_g1_i1.p1 TRINITY_DN67001_c0_g1~~TRINITY_DN67001_c0_g1_i1.p1  ORF type:complete len:417 (+),score=59.64 TRINITY_DN67001_c0_g1_i1:88-1338(+)
MQAQLEEDRLERRAAAYIAWAQRCAVARIELGGESAHTPGCLSPSVGEAIAASSLLCVRELCALNATARGLKRALSEPLVLSALLQSAVAQLQISRQTVDAAAARTEELEVIFEATRPRLRETSRGEVAALRQELNAAAPHVAARNGAQLLQLVSCVLQPSEKEQDDFAVKKLLSIGNVALRAAEIELDRLPPVLQRRLLRVLTVRRSEVECAVACGGLLGAFAAWLIAIHDSLRERPQLCEVYIEMTASAAQAKQLIRWALRPNPRARPPPCCDHLYEIAIPERPNIAPSLTPVPPPGPVVARPQRSRITASSVSCGSTARAANDANDRNSSLIEARVVETMARRPPLAAPASSSFLAETQRPDAQQSAAAKAMERWLEAHGTAPAPPPPPPAIRKEKRGSLSSCSTASTDCPEG